MEKVEDLIADTVISYINYVSEKPIEDTRDLLKKYLSTGEFVRLLRYLPPLPFTTQCLAIIDYYFEQGTSIKEFVKDYTNAYKREYDEN